MGKREGRKRDLPSGWNGALVRLGVLFLCGGIIGSVFVGLLSESDSLALSNYLADYLSLARGGTVVRVIPSLLWLRLGDLLVAVALGLNAVGVIGIPVLMALQGFLLAFSAGAFCLTFGWIGLVPGVVVFGLPALIWCPTLLFVCLQGMGSAGALLRRREWWAACTALYWLRICLCCAVCLLCVVVECSVVPFLLGRVAAFVL